jgi:hypothetical protein
MHAAMVRACLPCSNTRPGYHRSTLPFTARAVRDPCATPHVGEESGSTCKVSPAGGLDVERARAHEGRGLCEREAARVSTTVSIFVTSSMSGAEKCGAAENEHECRRIAHALIAG